VSSFTYGYDADRRVNAQGTAETSGTPFTLLAHPSGTAGRSAAVSAAGADQRL
jgi:hypothetical protein